MPEAANTMARMHRHAQSGIALIEALVAVLLFMVGILGLIGALSQIVSNEADVEYRSQAAKLAQQMMNTIWLSVDRTNDTTVATSLQGFSHLKIGSDCNFSGTASSSTAVTDWVSKITDGVANDVTARLPGATDTMQQIAVDITKNNRVTITLCWQGSKDVVPRKYALRAYIN